MWLASMFPCLYRLQIKLLAPEGWNVRDCAQQTGCKVKLRCSSDRGKRSHKVCTAMGFPQKRHTNGNRA